MSLYSLHKLINETRRLAAEFRRSTGTMLPVSGEIARFDVCQHIGLSPCNDKHSDYDAIGQQDRAGQRIQIKSRVIGDRVKSGHRIGQLNPDGDWDTVIVSLMDDEFEPLEMYEATREDILDAVAHHSNRKKRGAVSVAKLKIIGKLIWTRELGIVH